MSSSVGWVRPPLLAWYLSWFAAAPAAAQSNPPSEPRTGTSDATGGASNPWFEAAPDAAPVQRESAPTRNASTEAAAPESDAASEPANDTAEPTTSAEEAPAVTKTTCVQNHMHGQEARLDGSLVEARALFTRCADPACPTLVRADCQVWGMEVLEQLPKIVFRLAPDLDPKDVGVLANGKPIAIQYGVPMVFEPGPVELQFDVPGRPSLTQRLELATGQPHYAVSIEYPTEPSPPPAAAPVPAPLPPPSSKPAAVAELPTVSYVLSAIAIASAGVGTYYAVTGLDRHSEATRTCSPLCSAGEAARVRGDLLKADIAFGTAFVSAVAAVVVYFANEPDEPSVDEAVLRVNVASNEVGIEWGGQF